jgi:hypothetical protein
LNNEVEEEEKPEEEERVQSEVLHLTYVAETENLLL